MGFQDEEVPSKTKFILVVLRLIKEATFIGHGPGIQ